MSGMLNRVKTKRQRDDLREEGRGRRDGQRHDGQGQVAVGAQEGGRDEGGARLVVEALKDRSVDLRADERRGEVSLAAEGTGGRSRS